MGTKPHRKLADFRAEPRNVQEQPGMSLLFVLVMQPRVLWMLSTQSTMELHTQSQAWNIWYQKARRLSNIIVIWRSIHWSKAKMWASKRIINRLDWNNKKNLWAHMILKLTGYFWRLLELIIPIHTRVCAHTHINLLTWNCKIKEKEPRLILLSLVKHSNCILGKANRQ